RVIAAVCEGAARTRPLHDPGNERRAPGVSPVDVGARIPLAQADTVLPVVDQDGRGGSIRFAEQALLPALSFGDRDGDDPPGQRPDAAGRAIRRWRARA